MKKAAVLLAAALLILGLAGCGGRSYEELESVDTASMALYTAQNADFSVSYPSESWTADPDTLPLTVFLNETMDTDSAVNINVQMAAQVSGQLAESDMDALVSSIGSQAGFFTVEKSEMRLLNGQPVVLISGVTSITDEAIDFMLEQGVYTEEWIASIGGRDILLAIPDTRSLALYAVAGDYLFIYSGTYYNDSQLSLLTQAMTVMAQTTQVN